MTRLEEIKKRAEAATPGPWRHRDHLDSGDEYHDVLSDEMDRGVTNSPDWVIVFNAGQCCKECHCVPPEIADVEFASHAREDIPYLLGRLEAFAKHEAHLPIAMMYAKEDEPEFRAACAANGCEFCPLVLGAELARPRDGGHDGR